MKTKILAGIVTITTALIFISFFSCNHQKEQDEISPAKPAQVTPGELPKGTNEATVCCRADCSGGSCTAAKQVCNCSCNIDGTPNCTGGGTAITQIVSGDYVVTASTDQLNFQSRLIAYFQNSQNTHAPDAYNIAVNRYNLFLDNRGILTSTQSLQSYYTYSRSIQNIITQYFSSQEIQQIQSL